MSVPGETVVGNLVIYRGAAPTFRLTVKTSAGVVVPVAGWTSKLTLRVKAASPDPYTLQVSGTVVGDGSAGQIDYPLTKTLTLTLRAQDYEYSMTRIDGGSESVLRIGIATVKLNILDPKV